MGMNVPFKGVFKKSQDRFTPSTYKKGVISRVYVQSSTADVQIIGSSQTLVKAIPLASHIDPTTVSVGAKCRVDQFDESNPQDMVVAYIYGGGYVPVQGKHDKFASGTVFYTNGTSFPQNIVHGLGVVPDIYMVSADSNTWYAPGTEFFNWFAGTADATNIPVNSTASPSTIAATVYWFAIKFA